MPMRRALLALWITALATVGFSLSAPASEEAWDARTDFKFLELQRELREDPHGPRAHADMFAIAEYYFHENDLESAAGFFRRLDLSSDFQDPETLVATAYLARCASLAGDTGTAAALEKKLQEALSSKNFFASFDEKNVLSWTSPLGNRFDFRELVDRLEISINGSPFYTINLS
jgi:hypothetical protein